jgi:hypothetical protein
VVCCRTHCHGIRLPLVTVYDHGQNGLYHTPCHWPILASVANDPLAYVTLQLNFWFSTSEKSGIFTVRGSSGSLGNKIWRSSIYGDFGLRRQDPSDHPRIIIMDADQYVPFEVYRWLEINARSASRPQFVELHTNMMARGGILMYGLQSAFLLRNRWHSIRSSPRHEQ